MEAKENVVHFMDAYSIHESGIASHTGKRLFFRLTYDLKIFDRLGNTKNSMMNYDWPMIEREVHKTLWSPDISQLEESPYLPVTEPRKDTNELLVGVSGKSGSGKNWISFRIIQELRFQGVKAGKTSLAKEVYRQANRLIPLCQKNCGTDTLKEETGFAPSFQLEKLYSLWQGAVGDVHPEYGYHRRNENVRKGLELLSLIAREKDENYWLDKMIEDMKEKGFQAAVFSDMRFPNEADYARNSGFALRAELDPIWIKETMGRNPGYKYSQEALNSPIESALDDYPDFFKKVSAQDFDVEALVQEFKIV